MSKTYSELVMLPTFEERFQYLRLDGSVGEATFGCDRYLNQMMYNSAKWRHCRNAVLVRDDGCDLACPDHIIGGRVVVHHINPVTVDDLLSENSIVFDLDNLITVSHTTHEAIHFGDEHLLPSPLVERRRNDTCPWRC